MTRLTGPGGYAADICLRDGGKLLVFTFDNLWSAGPTEGRRGWGTDWLAKKGISSVAFMEPDPIGWFRGAAFPAFAAGVLAEIGAARFAARMCYGASMGGYAATAFAGLLGASRVLAVNPVSTLNTGLVPWETRFQEGRARDWDGPFHDGAAGLRSVAVLAVMYDPLFRPDRLHAERLGGIPLVVPGMGHALERHASGIGAIDTAFSQVAKGDVADWSRFRRQVRRRRERARYYEWMLSRENTHLTPARGRVIARSGLRLLGEAAASVPVLLRHAER